MKRILIAAFAAVIGLTLNIPEAEAKRFGGGFSSGLKRNSTITQRSTAPAPTNQTTTSSTNTATNTAAQPARSGASRWLGPVAGLAAGLGLAALFSHLGLGEEMATFFMLLLLVMAVVFVLRRVFGQRPAGGGPRSMQYAGAQNAPDYTAYQASQPLSGNTVADKDSTTDETDAIPAGFDAEGFVRQAKLNFVRLQAANDAGNMDDIRNFTTPEMFAEIQLQYQERNRADQQTDVVQLDAVLLDVSTEGEQQIASVRFNGQVREEADAMPEAFDEVWHLIRPLDGSKGWVIAGIQQR